MYKRWKIRHVLLVASLSLIGGLISHGAAYAQGESYIWQAPTKITGSSSGYPSTVTFTMTGKAGVFESQQQGTDCEAKLTLTVPPDSETKAKLTSDGKKCDFFNTLDKDIASVENADAQRDKVVQEEKGLTISYLQKICGQNALDNEKTSNPTPDEKKCLDENRATAEQKLVVCKTQHQYERNLIYAEDSLNCYAKALGVERDKPAAGNEKTPQASKCTIPGIGWIVCWTTYYLAQLTDFTFDLLTGLLNIEPLKEQVSNGKDTTVYGAWSAFRNIANVMFILAFCVIIYSQITGSGIGSYGIKKIAPRLVIASILVNASFFISGLAVDVSNIVGKNLQSVLVSMTPPKVEGTQACSNWSGVTSKVISITPTDKDPFCSNADQQALQQQQQAQDQQQQTEAIATNTVGGIALAGSALLYANLAALVPVMLFGLLAMVVTILILLVRQAIIIVLVVIAPLAFVAYLLPNTQKWFDKWRKTFVGLLMLYPAVSLVYGGSQLASRIIYDTASKDGQTFLTIFSLGIMVIPLFVTPLLIKFGGRVVNEFSGVMNNAISTPYKNLQGKAQDFRKSRKQLQQTRALNTGNPLAGGLGKGDRARRGYNMLNPYGYAQRSAMRGEKAKELAELNLKNARSEFLAGQDTAKDVAGFATKGINNDKEREERVDQLVAMAKNKEFEATIKAVEVETAKIDRVGFDGKDDMVGKGADRRSTTLEQMEAIALTGKAVGSNKAVSSTTRLAAIKKMAGTGSVSNAHKLINASQNMSADERKIMVAELRRNGIGSKAPHLGGSALGKVEGGAVAHVSELVNSAVEGGKFSQAAMASMDPDSARELAGVLRSGNDTAMRRRVRSDISTLLDSPEVSRNLNTSTASTLRNIR